VLETVPPRAFLDVELKEDVGAVVSADFGPRPTRERRRLQLRRQRSDRAARTDVAERRPPSTPMRRVAPGAAGSRRATSIDAAGMAAAWPTRGRGLDGPDAGSPYDLGVVAARVEAAALGRRGRRLSTGSIPAAAAPNAGTLSSP
jgi:hypothetical protein